MEDNNKNNSNPSGQAPQSQPILSQRGQYNPNLTQQHNAENANQASNQPNLANQQPAPQYGQFPPQQPQYNYQNPYAQQQPVGEKIKHSGLGISSFVLSIIAIIATVLCFVLVIAGMVDVMNNSSVDIDAFSDSAALNDMMASGEFGSGMVMIVFGGLLVFVSLGLAFIGAILGLIGVLQKNRKKVFSILGLIFNGLILFGVIIVTLIGLVA